MFSSRGMITSHTPIIGIDLGTTYFSAGILESGESIKHSNVEILNDENGKSSIPSYVTFTDDNDIIVGYAAKEQTPFIPKSSIYDSKRMLGHKFNDKIIKELMKFWPFKVVGDDASDSILIQPFQDQEKFYTPIDISSFLLKKVKKIYHDRFGSDVGNAVITVPASFELVQKEATKKAAEKAGFNVLRIIDEPTAAAIAYGLQEKYNEKKIILVFDFGGGTLDVSILEVENKHFNILAVKGNLQLGGQDLDNNLFEYFAKRFEEKHNINIRNNQRACHLLKNQCEKCKITLSSTTSYQVHIQALINMIDFDDKIDRATFEEINAKIFEQLLIPVKEALSEANIDKSKVDYVIMVGGSSRIPKVVSELQSFFGQEKICKNIDPEKAVTIGATIVAANLYKNNDNGDYDEDEDYPIYRYIPIVSKSLGVELKRKDMDVIIPKGFKVPYTSSPRLYTTMKKDKTKVRIKIFMGEEKETIRNKYIGSFIISDIQHAANDVPRIQLTFSIDIDGLLNVKAVDITAGTSNSFEVKVDKELDF
ncbi:heat shock cognate 71 kDa protein [Histomonas meleagridis]|uniref:heat shock cognate 71 kDa protein n=1 Tax=Histomonas meleagridis TaxID=135588 RepID=UPI00355AA526|nr:heat shock cognate 71 kDa protein [Histomonas meleagridis]KAH0797180.1 heat shock cognate 71 kDa protein [Histomonas meleagridis]